MTNPNTSAERVSSLERLSDRIYEAIDETTKGETRARKMLRLGVNLVGDELANGNELEPTGELLISFMKEQLIRGGLSSDDPVYNTFPRYQHYAKALPRPPIFSTHGLDRIANQYGDVPRATLDNKGERETNARHAIHLMALAVPYALQYYPRLLRPGVIAIDSLNHDFPEAIIGDTPTFGMSHEEYQRKLEREEGALEELGNAFGDEFSGLFGAVQDYEAQNRPEAQFVRQLDKEEPFFTHRINRGQQLISYYGILSAEQFLESTVPTSERIAAYPRTFPLLLEDRAEFIRRLAADVDWPIAN